MQWFSTRKRPPYLGPYPSEGLLRSSTPPDLDAVPPIRCLDFNRQGQPHSIVNAMREHQAMLDAIRDGLTNRAVADVPTCRRIRFNERST